MRPVRRERPPGPRRGHRLPLPDRMGRAGRPRRAGPAAPPHRLRHDPARGTRPGPGAEGVGGPRAAARAVGDADRCALPRDLADRHPARPDRRRPAAGEHPRRVPRRRHPPPAAGAGPPPAARPDAAARAVLADRQARRDQRRHWPATLAQLGARLPRDLACGAVGRDARRAGGPQRRDARPAGAPRPLAGGLADGRRRHGAAGSDRQ
jgi:hypothetical protein